MPANGIELQAENKPNRRPKARLLSLDDIDRRTNSGRRAFELRDRLVGERGGQQAVGTMRFLICNDVAAVSAMIEHELARWLSGEQVDASALATLMNVRRRDAELIGIDVEPRDVTPTLEEYLAQKREAQSDEAAA